MKVLHCCLLLMGVYTAHAQYNCKRTGAVCNGICMTEGNCDKCMEGFAGYDCSLPSGAVGGAGCDSVDCGVDGTCYSVEGTGTCHCPEDKTGPTCNMPVFDLTCEADKMTLQVNALEEAYPGVLSVFGQTDAACVYNADPVTTGELLDSACGGVEEEGTAKIRKFVHKQTAGITTSVDYFITTRCGTGDTVMKSVEVTEIEFVEEEDLIPQTEGQIPIDKDVMFDLMVNGEMINGSITLDDTLEVVADLTMVGKENFVALRFDDCVAKPSLTDAGMKLIDAGCPGELGGLMTAVTVDGTKISYNLKPFKFDDSEIVIIQCTIKVCDIPGDCDPEECTETRKKRQAGSGDKRVFGRSFKIKDPFTTVEEEIQTSREIGHMKTCNQGPEMLAAVVALSTALAVVLLICVVLIFKIMLKRPKTSPYEK